LVASRIGSFVKVEDTLRGASSVADVVGVGVAVGVNVVEDVIACDVGGDVVKGATG
jgi:hypothetical protein